MGNRYAHLPEKKYRPKTAILAMAVVLLVIMLFSFTLGRFPVPVREVLRIFAEYVRRGIEAAGRLVSPSFALPEIAETWTKEMETAVVQIRLPRILLACLVGCALSAAGTSYQGVFQNPMASPDILGASAGAAFGAALAILFGGSAAVITAAAFVSSLVAVTVVLLVARFAPGMRVINLVLAGMMISSLFTAATSYVKLVADPSNQLPQITYWLMGSLAGAKHRNVGFAVVPIAIGVVPIYLMRWRINILALGDTEAKAMGVNADRLRLVLIVCSTVVTAASVAVSGMIGWVGLVIPHLCRKLVGADNRYLVLASLLMGASFLLVVDDVSRNLLATEIPIGILTAFVGAPFFIYLICRKERSI